MSKKQKNVSDLYYFIKDNMFDILSQLQECRDLPENERAILEAQLDVLKEVNRICSERNRY